MLCAPTSEDAQMPVPPETTTLSSPDDSELVLYTWPAVTPRGIVQVTHGMGDHALRYAELAEALNSAGWTVVAQDQRGHGASAHSEDVLGQIGSEGWAALVSDLGAVREHVADMVDGPLVLLGHSMGSFAVQQFFPANPAGVDGVVLTGTAALDLLEPALDLEAPIDLAMFNAPFAPARTDFDWLSRDGSRVDAYIADPLTGFGLDIDGAKGLFAGAHRIANSATLAGVPKDLPVYVAVGADDPINGGLALVHSLVDRYRDAGLTDVALKVYEGARHELVNETNRDEVVADLVAWLDARFPSR